MRVETDLDVLRGTIKQWRAQTFDFVAIDSGVLEYQVRGYGCNEKEAIDNYNKNLKELINKLNEQYECSPKTNR